MAEGVDQVGRGTKRGPKEKKQTQRPPDTRLAGPWRVEQCLGGHFFLLAVDPPANAVFCVTDQGWVLGHYPSRL